MKKRAVLNLYYFEQLSVPEIGVALKIPAGTVKSRLHSAVIFICCVQGISVMKNFAFQMIHRHSIKREIKRLELRIAELAKTLAERVDKD